MREPIGKALKTQDVLHFRSHNFVALSSSRSLSLCSVRSDGAAKAVESACIGIWDLNLNSHKLTFNEHLGKMFEIPEGSLATYEELLVSRIHADDRLKVQEAHARGAATGQYDCQYRIARDDGSCIHVKACSENCINHDGTTSMVSA